MERYVDGFIVAVQRKNLENYRRLSEEMGKIWREYGALQYVETVGDDMSKIQGLLSFPELVKPKKDEVILFSWILYKSKGHRDEINRKVMRDPRVKDNMNKIIPFDSKRMAYGGFSTIVDK